MENAIELLSKIIEFENFCKDQAEEAIRAKGYKGSLYDSEIEFCHDSVFVTFDDGNYGQCFRLDSEHLNATKDEWRILIAKMQDETDQKEQAEQQKKDEKEREIKMAEYLKLQKELGL